MMKAMGKRGMMGRMFGGAGRGGLSEAELKAMQSELSSLDPKALEQLPAELKDVLKGGDALPRLPTGGSPRLPGLGGAALPGLPGFGGSGLPGLGRGLSK